MNLAWLCTLVVVVVPAYVLLLTLLNELVQVASSTLDASAKIYAGRVDCIHSETYKVLSGLGTSSSKQQPSEGGELQAWHGGCHSQNGAVG